MAVIHAELRPSVVTQPPLELVNPEQKPDGVKSFYGWQATQRLVKTARALPATETATIESIRQRAKGNSQAFEQLVIEEIFNKNPRKYGNDSLSVALSVAFAPPIKLI